MFPGLKNYREKQNNKIKQNQNTKKIYKNTEVSRRSFLPKKRKEQGTVSTYSI